MKKLSLFTKCLILFVVLWLFLRFFIGGVWSVPLPASVIGMYLGLILLAILVHVSVEDDRFREFLRPIKETLVDDNRRTRRSVLFALIPLVILGLAFSRLSTKADPPAVLRTAHPAPPLNWSTVIRLLVSRKRWKIPSGISKRMIRKHSRYM